LPRIVLLRITVRMLRTTSLFALFALTLTSPTAAQTQTAPPVLSLRGVSAVTADMAWASGTQGTYLRTFDGGKTVERHQVPGAQSLDFRDVEAFGDKIAYLLAAGPGDSSRIYKTVDGGKNWTMQFTNHEPQGFLDCMAFWDADHGMVVGDPVGGKFMVLTTKDGGRHWQASPGEKMPAAAEGEGAFAASGTCIAVQGKKDAWFVTGGSAARVFHSKDRGASWTVAETPLLHGKPPQGGFAVAFRDAMHGLVVGGDYQESRSKGTNAAYSDDGGATWHAIQPGSDATMYLSAIRYLSGDAALAVGPVGAVIITRDTQMIAKDSPIGNTFSAVPGLLRFDGYPDKRVTASQIFAVFVAGPADRFLRIELQGPVQRIK
jgi:photosystem II stability/assembly factor-like uncharacterized protein